VRDFRETTEQAWTRLGLLAPDEAFTPDRYAACVKKNLAALKAHRLLTPRVEQIYLGALR
jgi:hypothetical protein